MPNLIRFTPTLTAASQVRRLTVYGWDPRTKQSIRRHRDRGQPARRHGRRADRARRGHQSARGPRGNRDRRAGGHVEEARALAIALLRERAYQFITGTGRIAGLPLLRPRDVLEIHGIGRRFSGNYFVTRVEHTLGGSGFFTEFTVRRIADD